MLVPIIAIVVCVCVYVCVCGWYKCVCPHVSLPCMRCPRVCVCVCLCGCVTYMCMYACVCVCVCVCVKGFRPPWWGEFKIIYKTNASILCTIVS